jgi:hypothetical protein
MSFGGRGDLLGDLGLPLLSGLVWRIASLENALNGRLNI